VHAVHCDVAVFPNLRLDHRDYHGDMVTYGEAKARLFSRDGLRAAVVNLDDDYGRALFERIPAGVQRIGTSARGDATAQVRADQLALDASGIAFDLLIHGTRVPVRSSLLGRFNIANLLVVAGVLSFQGVEPQGIADVLSRLQPIPGRMNRLGGDGVLPLVVIDYSHKPDPLEQALASLRGHLRGRLICVFGCGGERDRGKRPQMAAIAEANADIVIVTDDNPRGEDGDAIVADIMAGFSNPDAIAVERDRRKAIARAIGAAGADDIVLIAGKGHETYQEVAGVKHPFDDGQVARELLEGRA
jgi:UDP-N-acetylmuramoyl-L-alanyl-D-glutamate--2,6-diaminopimelate ligase